MLAAAERQHNLCNLQTAAASLQRTHTADLFAPPAFSSLQHFNLFPNTNHQNYLIAAAACHQFAAMLSANQNSAILSANPNSAIMSANQSSALPLLPLGHSAFSVDPIQGRMFNTPQKRIADTEYNNSNTIDVKNQINS